MFLLIVILFLECTCPTVYAAEQETFFARIMFEQVYLYSSPIDDNSYSNIMFELPKTYFVELVDSANSNFYKAKYLNFTGYVKKNSVQAVENKPTVPFLENISFRVYAELSQKIYATPSLTSNLIVTMPPLTRNITYIGKIAGDTAISGRTNIWYYCKFSNNYDYYGYVYSDFCDELSTIVNNTENLNYIENPTFTVNIKPQNTIPANDNIVGVVVGILSVPALIFVFLLSRGKHFVSKPKVNSKEVVDYQF